MSRHVTARALARRLGVCVETVRRAVRRGIWPAHFTPGGELRFHPEDLDAIDRWRRG